VGANRKPSPQTARVLTALAADPEEWRYGYDLVRQTGLQVGTLYPILMRLAERGQVESRWAPGAGPGRPPRHMYRPTSAGLALAAECRPDATAVPRAVLRLQPGGAS
jgi:DNA-binding PadR family transcriptional regulator